MTNSTVTVSVRLVGVDELEREVKRAERAIRRLERARRRDDRRRWWQR